MIFNMVGKGGGGSLLISDTLDANGGIIRTITATKTVKLQTKTITPTSSVQVIDPDTGYDGFSQVTVGAGSGGTPTLETISKTYTPSTSAVTDTITASAGYDGIEEVDVTVSAVPAAGYDVGLTSIYATENNSRKFKIRGTVGVDVAGWITDGDKYGEYATYNAIAKNTSITPIESSQTIGGANTMMEGAVTVNAIPSNYVGSGIASRSSSDLTTSGATVTVPAGYYSSQATKSVANGSATGPSSLSGSSATVSTGTNTITLTKTGVTTTPTVSAGYVSSATASTATVTLTASVTTKAAATYHPSLTDQTISASQYLTGAQTIKAVTITNLTAANIKKDVVVKIGDSTDDDCVTTITGTYEGSGGGAALTVDTSTATLSSAATSISFTGLAGEPTSFAVVSAAELATGASPWKTAAVVFDGMDLHGQTIRNTSNAQVTYDGSSFSKTYSNGTLTITGSGTNFQANQYKLVYTYGGSDIGTADVQVGSGATSITFTGLEEEPSYFSCIFKSNFSTSSGYQRVIVVVYDGTSTYGMEMDSSAKHSTAHWTYSYSSGSLTITSSGTNAGGYFHQPGYYQLTYAVEGSGRNYQTKSATYYATSSQQTASIAADNGYDALKKVNITIAPVTITNLSASNIVSGVTIQVGDAADSDRIASVTGNVVLQNYYTGSSAPSSSTGSNGDLYLQT